MDFDDLRYERPRLYITLLIVVAIVAGGTIFAALPATPFFRAIGVTTLQERAGALHRAIYWDVRATLHPDMATARPNTTYGNVRGIDPDGSLVVSLPDGHQYVDRRMRLADLVIVDIQRTTALIADIRLDDARLDIYIGDQVVVWARGQPLNVRLIEIGAATPDPNPPTNIVDRAFASYYWSLVKGATP